jgi:hypothetical protein
LESFAAWRFYPANRHAESWHSHRRPCAGRLNAPLKSTPFTIGFFSNTAHAAVAKPDVDPSHFFTPRQADKLWRPAILVEWPWGACGEMQHPSKWRMPPRNGTGHLLLLRALVFRPCVRGLKACETALLESAGEQPRALEYEMYIGEFPAYNFCSI